jgi:hypothetical protein
LVIESLSTDCNEKKKTPMLPGVYRKPSNYPARFRSTIFLIPPKVNREELSLCNPYLMGFEHANLKCGTQQAKTPQNYTK